MYFLVLRILLYSVIDIVSLAEVIFTDITVGFTIRLNKNGWTVLYFKLKRL